MSQKIFESKLKDNPSESYRKDSGLDDKVCVAPSNSTTQEHFSTMMRWTWGHTRARPTRAPGRGRTEQLVKDAHKCPFQNPPSLSHFEVGQKIAGWVERRHVGQNWSGHDSKSRSKVHFHRDSKSRLKGHFHKLWSWAALLRQSLVFIYRSINKFFPVSGLEEKQVWECLCSTSQYSYLEDLMTSSIHCTRRQTLSGTTVRCCLHSQSRMRKPWWGND